MPCKMVRLVAISCQVLVAMAKSGRLGPLTVWPNQFTEYSSEDEAEATLIVLQFDIGCAPIAFQKETKNNFILGKNLCKGYTINLVG